ncbi:hypothetical protein [Methylohalobius crimeensis]|uniref:hypothetical protein n=1 Tax=Methylohalobius crimeensis TaxID=244365 RepID=UPI0012697403|nr:hypothetical protein [Methylohalobius crimeensis]
MSEERFLEHVKVWQAGVKNNFKTLDVDIGGFTVDVINTTPEQWPRKLKDLAKEAAEYGIGLDHLTIVRHAMRKADNNQSSNQDQVAKNTDNHQQEELGGFPGININLPSIKIPGFQTFPRKKKAISGLEKVATEIENGKEIDNKKMARIGMNAASSILSIKSEKEAEKALQKLSQIRERMNKLNSESAGRLAKIAEAISQSLAKLFSVLRPGATGGANASLG